MVRAMILAALTAAACRGGGAVGGHGGGSAGPVAAPVDAGPVVAAASAPLTVRECDDLIAHAVAMAGAERGSGSATAAEQDAVASSLRADLGARCASLPRTVWACAMASTTLAALAACDR